MTGEQRAIIDDMVATHIDYGESMFRADCDRLLSASDAEIERLNRRIEELEADYYGGGKPSKMFPGTITGVALNGLYAEIIVPEDGGKDMSEEIRKEKDGTWTVDFDWCGVDQINGIPSRELAERIERAMWGTYKAGGDSYAMSEF